MAWGRPNLPGPRLLRAFCWGACRERPAAAATPNSLRTRGGRVHAPRTGCGSHPQLVAREGLAFMPLERAAGSGVMELGSGDFEDRWSPRPPSEHERSRYCHELGNFFHPGPRGTPGEGRGGCRHQQRRGGDRSGQAALGGRLTWARVDVGGRAARRVFNLRPPAWCLAAGGTLPATSRAGRTRFSNRCATGADRWARARRGCRARAPALRS